MEQVHCGICDIGLLVDLTWAKPMSKHVYHMHLQVPGCGGFFRGRNRACGGCGDTARGYRLIYSRQIRYVCTGEAYKYQIVDITK